MTNRGVKSKGFKVFGNLFNGEVIDVYVDDKKVDECVINDSKIIQKRIEYEPLASQMHKLTVSNRNDSVYSQFSHALPFYTEKLDTNIVFGYDKIQKDVENDFIVIVNEDDIHTVANGNVTILIDEEVVADNEPLINGTYTFKRKFTEKGQYSVFIHYHDTENCYNDSTQTFLINVDIYPISIENLPETIELDIGKTTLIKNNVIDASHRLVYKGYFNIYIDGIQIAKSVVLNVGQLIYELQLPNYIDAGDHVLKFEYIDTTDGYLDTNIYRTLKVNKIKTSNIIRFMPF